MSCPNRPRACCSFWDSWAWEWTVAAVAKTSVMAEATVGRLTDPSVGMAGYRRV
jgi:hypothetical protein